MRNPQEQKFPRLPKSEMQRLSSQIQTYTQARAYIMDQVLTRRDPWFGDEKKTKSGGQFNGIGCTPKVSDKW